MLRANGAVFISITLTEFRKTLAEQMDHVRSGGAPVLIWRFGKPAAALVSLEHLDMIAEWEQTVMSGPRDAKGYRIGRRAWLKMMEKFGLARENFEHEVELHGKRAFRGESFTAHRMRDEVRHGDWHRDGRLKDLED